MYLYIASHPCLVVLCKFNTVSEHISSVCFIICWCLSLFNVTFFKNLFLFTMLIVCIGIPCIHLLIQKHAIVYFSIICKLIKFFLFFPDENVLLYGKKVATYSEYLVEVDFFFLRIYTHINIYCKSISFCLNSLRLSDWNCSWTDNMHGFFSWVTLFFLCACKPRELRNCSVFFLSLSFSFSPLFFLFLRYLCLLTYCIYILFFSVTVIFTSSLDALTMQTHSSFNHLYSFLPSPQLSIATEEFMGTWGQKHKPTLFGGEARLEYKEP